MIPFSTLFTIVLNQTLMTFLPIVIILVNGHLHHYYDSSLSHLSVSVTHSYSSNSETPNHIVTTCPFILTHTENERIIDVRKVT